MQLVVEATGVADGLAVLVASPEGGGSRLAVGTAGASTSRRALQRLQHNTQTRHSQARHKHLQTNNDSLQAQWLRARSTFLGIVGLKSSNKFCLKTSIVITVG